MSTEERESKIRALEGQLTALKRMRAPTNGDGGRPRKRLRHPNHGKQSVCAGLPHVARSAICNSYYTTFDCPKGFKCELVCKATRRFLHYQRPAGWRVGLTLLARDSVTPHHLRPSAFASRLAGLTTSSRQPSPVG